MVLAKNKDGSLRFCMDYRELNVVTRKMCMPALNRLHFGCTDRIKVVFHLGSSQWLVEMHPDDHEKTALCTADGLF